VSTGLHGCRHDVQIGNWSNGDDGNISRPFPNSSDRTQVVQYVAEQVKKSGPFGPLLVQ
jgi:hypothetical protein